MDFEYYETTVPLSAFVVSPSERPYPPREAGTGWEFLEEETVGNLTVYRWRRPERAEPQKRSHG